jgi:8-oxo-dGTP diphosphatase
MKEIIFAAGAVVWRQKKGKSPQVAVIHRPKYGTWSFPKGKCEIGEELIACAHREVLEETNIATEFGPFLGEVNYQTKLGAKQVYFWSAKVIDENTFIPTAEVDQLKWVAAGEVRQFLSTDTDKEIFDKFIKFKLDTKPLIFLRHAKAVSRDVWQGDDCERPLDDLGEKQARRLLATYQVFNLTQIHTSDALRCYNTVYPLSKGLGVKLEVTGKLSEAGFRKDKERAFEYAKELLKAEVSALICSHNPILPKLLSKLSNRLEIKADQDKLQPADGWVIHRVGKEILQIDRLNAPRI